MLISFQKVKLYSKSARSFASFFQDHRGNEISKNYQQYLQNKKFLFPQDLYGKPKGKLLDIEVEDSPIFGEKSFIQIDTARTAFLCVGIFYIFSFNVIIFS